MIVARHMVGATSRLVAVTALAACLDHADRCPELTAVAGGHYECAVAGWTDRAFDLALPASWDGMAQLPAVVVFHGGGGSRITTNRSTCPDGDVSDPSCIVAMATRRGYVVVLPDGTGGRPLRGVRTWNGGGGHELQCTSGGACAANVDDMAYFDDLLDELRATFPLDERRIYATGISNGSAISHRLACERAGNIAAIVGIAGANQFADDGGACDVQVPVRQIHGTADPCWRFDGGEQSCLQDDGKPKTSVAATMEGWRTRNGCTADVVEVARTKRDRDDPTTLVVHAWSGCAATTELYRVVGGGHTWPSGHQYFDVGRIGPVSFEVDNADILDFFDAHVRP